MLDKREVLWNDNMRKRNREKIINKTEKYHEEKDCWRKQEKNFEDDGVRKQSGKNIRNMKENVSVKEKTVSMNKDWCRNKMQTWGKIYKIDYWKIAEKKNSIRENNENEKQTRKNICLEKKKMQEKRNAEKLQYEKKVCEKKKQKYSDEKKMQINEKETKIS